MGELLLAGGQQQVGFGLPLKDQGGYSAGNEIHFLVFGLRFFVWAIFECDGWGGVFGGSEAGVVPGG